MGDAYVGLGRCGEFFDHSQRVGEYLVLIYVLGFHLLRLPGECTDPVRLDPRPEQGNLI